MQQIVKSGDRAFQTLLQISIPFKDDRKQSQESTDLHSLYEQKHRVFDILDLVNFFHVQESFSQDFDERLRNQNAPEYFELCS